MSEASHALVLTFEDARSVVEEHASHVTCGSSETLDLLQAIGRVLAEPIAADRDIPPFPRSTRDGYAVRSSDLAKLPVQLAVKGEIKAGPLPANAPFVVHPEIPPFPRSTRDGYAVRSSDLAKLPVQLAVKGEIKAGPLPANAPFVVHP